MSLSEINVLEAMMENTTTVWNTSTTKRGWHGSAGGELPRVEVRALAMYTRGLRGDSYDEPNGACYRRSGVGGAVWRSRPNFR